MAIFDIKQYVERTSMLLFPEYDGPYQYSSRIVHYDAVYGSTTKIRKCGVCGDRQPIGFLFSKKKYSIRAICVLCIRYAAENDGKVDTEAMMGWRKLQTFIKLNR